MGLTFRNDDASVVDVLINFYFRELSSKGKGLWNFFRISSCGGMTLRRVAVGDGGRERKLLQRWRKGGHREMSRQNENRTWLEDRTLTPDFFSLLEECSELLCKGCKKSTGGKLMAGNRCRKIPQKGLVPFLSAVSFLLFNSNRYKFMYSRNNFLGSETIILMSFLLLTATKKKSWK